MHSNNNELDVSSDKYYVYGCTEFEGGVGYAEDEDAQFWTVYERDANGLSQAIVDCSDKESALRALAAFIERDQLAAELKQSQIDAGCYKTGMEASNERLFQVTAENVALNNFIAQSCCVQAGEDAAWYPAIDHSPETPVTNQLSIEESRFLTDVITAAGLLSCGKKDKELARRITDFCVAKRGSSKPAQLRNEVKV